MTKTPNRLPRVRIRQVTRRILPISPTSPNRYSSGGHHPVRTGDELHDGKYKVIAKHSHGVYSTVWLVFNPQYDTYDIFLCAICLPCLQQAHNRARYPETHIFYGDEITQGPRIQERIIF
ncbi:hypothetical protein GGR50DRAFT_208634 [Xylaria sp. CBS 124048]|nr:hypothetical protein GGR50DRAFT_208634 [Xylaria sp. CBS 124048]